MTLLGKYELHEQLGKGGFGIVYRATDTVLGREVAIKVLHPQLAVDVDFVARFQREAQVIAKFDHPNIVAVFDTGQVEGRFYIAMRYLPGGSLADLLKKGSLPFERASEILKQVCDGLQAAHAQGLVHRDLKPGNILFDTSGQAVVSDFGQARAFADGGASTSTSLGVVGTPFYRAPELWRGKPPASPATDVYSLGCVLVEMLTGISPFHGDTPDEVLTRHLIDGPDFGPTWPPAGIPAGLARVVDKALARNPEGRYQDVHSFNLALEQFVLPEKVSQAQTTIVPPTAPVSASSASRPTLNLGPLPATTQPQQMPPVKNHFRLALRISGVAVVALIIYIFIPKPQTFVNTLTPTPTILELTMAPTTAPQQASPTLFIAATPVPLTPEPFTPSPLIPPPLSTPSETSTPEPSSQTTKLTIATYLRAGPDLYHPATTNFLPVGSGLTIIAKNEDSQWFLVRTKDGIEGWLSILWIEKKYDESKIAVASVIPSPFPSFTPTYTPSPEPQRKYP